MFYLPGGTGCRMPDCRSSPWMWILGLERLVASWMAVRSQTAATMWLDHRVFSLVIRQRRGEVKMICCHQSCLLDLCLAPSLYLARAGF